MRHHWLSQSYSMWRLCDTNPSNLDLRKRVRDNRSCDSECAQPSTGRVDFDSWLLRRARGRKADPLLPLSEMHSTEKNSVAAKSAPQPYGRSKITGGHHSDTSLDIKLCLASLLAMQSNQPITVTRANPMPALSHSGTGDSKMSRNRLDRAINPTLNSAHRRGTVVQFQRTDNHQRRNGPKARLFCWVDKEHFPCCCCHTRPPPPPLLLSLCAGKFRVRQDR